mmetsp:Transcript_13380/g.36793  ORF Transcript_13380/g.36793 Transcript_13380/m.36793 type:complete len:169 (-) Transcript_13380:9-515(-)
MANVDGQLKQLNIKINSVKRLTKELDADFRDGAALAEKLEKLKQDGADSYDVNKQGEFIDENKNCVKHLKARTMKFARELRDFVQTDFVDTLLELQLVEKESVAAPNCGSGEPQELAVEPRLAKVKEAQAVLLAAARLMGIAQEDLEARVATATGGTGETEDVDDSEV